jgi:hypothetical protein
MISARCTRSHLAAALKALEPLSREVANCRGEERERTDAWLAVCRVWKTLAEDPNCGDVAELWDDAIAKMAVWHDA